MEESASNEHGKHRLMILSSFSQLPRIIVIIALMINIDPQSDSTVAKLTFQKRRNQSIRMEPTSIRLRRSQCLYWAPGCCAHVRESALSPLYSCSELTIRTILSLFGGGFKTNTNSTVQLLSALVLSLIFPSGFPYVQIYIFSPVRGICARGEEEKGRSLVLFVSLFIKHASQMPCFWSIKSADVLSKCGYIERKVRSKF